MRRRVTFVANYGGIEAVGEQADLTPICRSLGSAIESNAARAEGVPRWPYEVKPQRDRVQINSAWWHWAEYGYMQFGRRSQPPQKIVARAVQSEGHRWEDSGG